MEGGEPEEEVLAEKLLVNCGLGVSRSGCGSGTADRFQFPVSGSGHNDINQSTATRRVEETV